MADQQGEQRLDGWKSIARHLGRDERTVKRWEARGLPVHRVPGGERARVYAVVGEVDRWLNAADPGLIAEVDEPVAAAELSPAAASAATSAASLVSDRAHVGQLARDAAKPRRRVLLAALGAVVGAATLYTAAHRSVPVPAAAAAPAPAPAPARLTDPEARERYLEGLHAWNLRTPASLAQAREDFGAAIAREPAYAPAYAGLANTYLLLREFGTMPDAEAYSKAMAAAETALRLDPTLAAAHRARAFALYWGQHQHQAAWAEFDRAARLAPGDALTWHWYATALDGADRYGEAVRMIERARALDPSSTAILADKGVIVYRSGNRTQGRALEQRVIALDPTNIDAHRDLARMAATEGRSADADAEWQRVAALGGNSESRPTLARDLEAVRAPARLR